MVSKIVFKKITISPYILQPQPPTSKSKHKWQRGITYEFLYFLLNSLFCELYHQFIISNSYIITPKLSK